MQLDPIGVSFKRLVLTLIIINYLLSMIKVHIKNDKELIYYLEESRPGRPGLRYLVT